MEKFLKTTIICLSLYTTTSFSDTLVLSTKLKIDYPNPVLIAHGSEDLIVKYKDWSFFHTVFNSKTFYSQIDLTGLEKDFIRLMFGYKEKPHFPEWFPVLAKGQADAFGITPDNSKKFNIGNSEILTTHDESKKKGYIFIIEELAVHQISIHGTQKELNLIVKNIRER